MNTPQLLIFSMVAAAVGIFPFPTTYSRASAPDPAWYMDLDQATSVAKAEGRPLMVVFR
jgi:hypothetical protein